MNKFLTATDELTLSITRSGITDFTALVKAVHLLPYGRNTDRADLTQVWTEQRGTCSSKHAFLKLVAADNNIDDVQLKVCIFKMNSSNTPAIADILAAHEIEYIPEAHCYLVVDGQAIDITFQDSDIEQLSEYILEEQIVEADFVISEKVQYHKSYLQGWLLEQQLPYDLLEFWSVREQCIARLSAD